MSTVLIKYFCVKFSTNILTISARWVTLSSVNDRILTIREAAELRGVTAGAVYQWQRTNGLPRVWIETPLGRFAGVRESDLLAFEPRSVGRPPVYPKVAGGENV